LRPLDIFTKIKDSKHLMILCKVEFNDTGYKTLGHLRSVNFTDKDLFIEYLLARLGLIIESMCSCSSITQIL
jgi:hypothetical protein